MIASRSFRLLIAVVALGLLLALPGGALAAKPTFHDTIDDTFADNFCGVDGTSHVTGVQTGAITFDANGNPTVVATGEITQTFTSADGRSVTMHDAGSGASTIVDNGDGTVTITVTDKGLSEQIRGAGGGVVTRGAGLLTVRTTLDFSGPTLVVVSRDVLVEHGPHPEDDSDYTLFCDAFLTALG